ncbi:Protein of unknown function [Klenkia soli]|uniref:DUF3048 domain-containing protein n=1 Tax=Klenkia soli TaxID=1052260 RepID=A0A1H0KMW0_9ACTN|nr:DUF3048 domain-containing protein [Klenkia soli]SDO57324.1 Protein of unknown function [Klenkia soli]
MRGAVRGRRRGAVLVLAAVVLAGCGGEAPVPVAAPTGTTTAAPTTAAPVTTAAPQPVAPLTGLPVSAVEARAALAVKIENPAVARPQAGLTEADVVWEQVVEGGISRFVAVYQSRLPASIGPVRSTRPMDPAIAAPLHGLFATSGGQGQYLSAVSASGLQLFSFDAGDDGFARQGPRPAPHNVYLDPAALYAAADADHRTPPAPQFGYAPTAGTQTTVAQGTAASGVDLQLSPVAAPSWRWDPVARTWARSEAGTPATAADGVPVTATDVVVLRVEVVATDAVDPAGNPVPETLLAGRSGEGLVATAGRTVPITWTKGAEGDPIALVAPDGSPVLLAPGTTWVELVPTGSGSVTVVP